MSHPSYHEKSPEGIDLIRWPHRDHRLPESEVIVFFTSRNIEPTRWTNAPNTVHAAHAHDYRKMLFCIAGGITFSFPELNREYTLSPGDRLIVPIGLKHSALVGSEGVSCIEGKGRE